MSLKVKVGALVAATPALQKVAQIENLPLKQVYDCARFLKLAEPELNAFEQARRELVKRVGVHDEKKQSYNIPPDKAEEFQAEYEKLADNEVELKVSMIDLSTVPPETVTGLKPADVLVLMPFIEYGDNGKAKS
jgi:hypothetical protein